MNRDRSVSLAIVVFCNLPKIHTLWSFDSQEN